MSTLKRKESLRTSYARKLKDEGRYTSFEHRNKAGHIRVIAKQRKPLKKQSRSQRERLKQYFPIRNEFLAQPEHQWCGICLARGRNPNPATEVHHRFGRNGPNLFDVRGFVPSCYSCRDFPNTHGKEARSIGVLGEAWEYDVPIDKHRNHLTGTAKTANIAP